VVAAVGRGVIRGHGVPSVDSVRPASSEIEECRYRPM
jgi:hypothetical protein